MNFDDQDDLLEGETVPLKPADSLVIHEEGQPDRIILLEKAIVTLGRAIENDIVLVSPQISRRHARIARSTEGLYFVEDLDSRNGTYIGDRKLAPNEPQRWEAGVWLRLGPYLLSLKPFNTEEGGQQSAITTMETPAVTEEEADDNLRSDTPLDQVEERKREIGDPSPAPQSLPPAPPPAQPMPIAPPAPVPPAPGGGSSFGAQNAPAAPPAIEVPVITPPAPPDFKSMSPGEIVKWADEALARQQAGEQAVPRNQPTESTETQFATYYPREVEPDKWLPMTAYVFKSTAADQVAKDAEHQLGGLIGVMRRIAQAARRTIPSGTFITATPVLSGFQFNPPSVTVGYFEDWHRFDFKLRAKDAPLNQATNGLMTFTVEGIIVADIPLSIYVGDAVSASQNILITQKPYESIFCSYSRDDTHVVERVERVYRALGFDFLRDVHTLKSGQHWSDEIYTLIDKADIFQLFWSETAANSEYVEKEWRHALALDRDEANFIRPVYWQQPLPPVPTELSQIHFAYEPGLGE